MLIMRKIRVIIFFVNEIPGNIESSSSFISFYHKKHMTVFEVQGLQFSRRLPNIRVLGCSYSINMYNRFEGNTQKFFKTF